LPEQWREFGGNAGKIHHSPGTPSLNKPLLGTLVAVLAGKHDAITPKHGKSHDETALAALTTT
jgi:hypothetical protein